MYTSSCIHLFWWWTVSAWCRVGNNCASVEHCLCYYSHTLPWAHIWPLSIIVAAEAWFFKFDWNSFPGLLVVQQLNFLWVKWKFILLHQPQQLSFNSCFRQKGRVVTADKWANSKSEEISKNTLLGMLRVFLFKCLRNSCCFSFQVHRTLMIIFYFSITSEWVKDIFVNSCLIC